ncbi:MAG: DUF6516 family protein [Acidobacteriaceae bacterium]
MVASREIDHGLENLLALDGDTYVIHESGYWVKFEVQRATPSPQWPHGIRYSLTLHGPNNERLLGFDNAHSVRTTGGPAGRNRLTNDHRHKSGTIRPYKYESALKLIEDFWEAVDQVLKERTKP